MRIAFNPSPTGPYGVYPSRIPPLPSPLHQWPSQTLDFSLPVPSFENPGLELVIRDLLLPDRLQPMLPTFYGATSGFVSPFYPHPNLDLHIPRHPLTLKDGIHSLVTTNVTPRCIGLTFTDDTFRRSSLRLLASIQDREGLLHLLFNLSKLVELRGFDLTIQKTIARDMRLRQPLQHRLLKEIGPQRILFDKACLQWLIEETLAANPPPWGIPAPTTGTRELERLCFPSLASNVPARVFEVLRAVFFAHQGFVSQDVPSEDNEEDLALSILTASSLREIDLFPASTLGRMTRIWNNDPNQRATRRLLSAFKDKTGIDYRRLILFVCLMSFAEASKSNPKPTEGQFLGVLHSIDSFERSRLMDFLIERCSAPLPHLRRSVLKELKAESVDYRGWGDVPVNRVRVFAKYPIIVGDSRVHVNTGQLTLRIRELMFEVADEAGVADPKGLYGQVFEGYVAQLASHVTPRHQIVTESAIRKVIGKDRSVPDLLIGFDGNLLSVEIYSNFPKEPIWKGELGAVKNQLGRYRRKHSQTAAINPFLSEIAQQCFGWHGVKNITRLLVTEEAPTITPLTTQQRQVAICPIAAFERLIGLAAHGWIASDLVDRWQKDNPSVPLGVYLRQQCDITPINRWRTELDGLSIYRTLINDPLWQPDSESR